MSVIPRRGAGFFSCCSVRLGDIVEFINLNSKLPDIVDSTNQFALYKSHNEYGHKKDITFEYFEHYNNIENIESNYPLEYNDIHQFVNYSLIDYERINPLTKKYFSPSTYINELISNMEQKYKLIYDNICVLFYRGNDKIRETQICSYDEYIKYANEIIERNPNILFLIQSDETEFIEFMTNKYPERSFYFKDEIRHMEKCNDTVDLKMQDKSILHICNTNREFSKKYLAITIIMSKCKYIICGSGNCSIWIMLYRGNNKNVIQNLNGNWYNTIV